MQKIPLLPGLPDLNARWLGAAALVAVLALAGGWFAAHLAHRHARNASQAASTSLPISSTASSTQPLPAAQLNRHGAPVPVRANLPVPVNTRGASAQAPAARSQWRVIVFTYNHPDEAQKKSASIAQKHPGLDPAVFTPTGHAPYLVTIGGVMNRDAAYALARRSRGSGLPRDTYPQNYASVSR